METEEILGAAAFAVTMAVLVSASIRDWREREVPDGHWIVLGLAGLAVLVTYSVCLTGPRWEYIPLAAGTAMILADIFLDREFNPLVFYSVMAVLFIVPLFDNMSWDIFRAWASVPLCYLVFVGMYFLGIVRGGADVKCLITLSVMLPIYPSFFGLPLIDVPGGPFSQIFVFSVSVLFVAGVMTLPLPLYFAVRNLRDTGISSGMFSGYRMDISKAESAYVWPTEDIIGGTIERIRIPEEEEMGAIYARLKESGREKVRVTPMIPFIVFIALSAAFVSLVGSPLFIIF